MSIRNIHGTDCFEVEAARRIPCITMAIMVGAIEAYHITIPFHLPMLRLLKDVTTIMGIMVIMQGPQGGSYEARYDQGFVRQDYRSYDGPSMYTTSGCSRNVDQYHNNSNDFSCSYNSPPRHFSASSDGFSNDVFSPIESYDHVIADDMRSSRENLSALHRSRSCSDFDISDDEERRPSTVNPRATPTIENTERRKHYPLAQIPIPTFSEFKRKSEVKTREISDGKLETPVVKMQHSTPSEEGRDFKTKTREKLRSTDFLTTSRHAPKGESDSLQDVRAASSDSNTDKSNDYYSHNDIIHNLMLKYGLYERSGRRKDAVKTDVDSSSKTESSLELRRKRDSAENTERTEKQETLYKQPSVSTGRDAGRRTTRRSPRSERRQTSAIVQQHNVDAPKLTRKSKSTLSPGSLSDVTEDLNNNTKATDVKEQLSSASSPSLGAKQARHRTASRTDLLSIADVYRTVPKQVAVTAHQSDPPINTSESVAMDPEKSPGIHKASKTLWAAAKVKLKLGKSPTNSPFLKRKDKGQLSNDKKDEDTNADKKSNKNETSLKTGMKDVGRAVSPSFFGKGKRSPSIVKDLVDDDNPRKMSLETSPQGQLQKGGLHTSLLSIASSFYSTDNELDDSCSWHSDGNDTERSASSRRRWESFHSNISADSGSAHMYDFENDSLGMEDHFDDNEKDSENRKKSDSEIERTDSGIGGDIGCHKQSWEDIVLKSSKRWSIVAASAKHWQDVAKKNKMAKEVRRKSNPTPVITEDMVECLDCQKYFVPEMEKNDQTTETSSKSDTTICPKCCERRVERKEAIIELVQTEINYANDLQILKEEFYSPLQSGGILQPDHLAEIFLNLQELVEVSTKFSSRLQKALEVSVSKGNEEFSQVNVGSIFLESVDFFQSYEIYCTKQNSSSLLLESLQKKNELLKIFLNVTCRENPKCRKMDLNSFLLAPVQRIMKYPLLLSRIRKATPRRNPDREKLMQAQRKIEEQLNRINSLNSTVESRQRRYRSSGHLGRSDSTLDQLQMKKMASEILNWAMGEMYLLMHGVFEVVIHEFVSSGGWSRRGSKRTVDVFMLFCVSGLSEPKIIDSDEDNAVEEPLFPSEADATNAALVMLRKKMNGKYTLFKEPLSLDSCVVCRDS
ncbi:hypothetical protein QZH41_012073, partial [Actinostola sp. cb2023]